jgi:hypothetical protein
MAVLFADDAVTLAHTGAVFVNLWRGTITIERLERVVAVERQLFVTHPKLGVVTVIEPSTPLIRNDAREAGDRLQKETAKHLIAMAYVIEGGGFMAAAARGVLATTQLLLRSAFPMKAFADPDNAAKWISPIVTQVVAPVAPDAIVKVIGEARQKGSKQS